MTGLSISYQFCALTDPGRVRANNEDAVTVDPVAQLAVLADGMGGYNAGEVASGRVLRRLDVGQVADGIALAETG